MRRRLLTLCEGQTVLIAASLLAVVSIFIVTPDRQYLDYVHTNTIGQLVCLMLVVCGFQRIGLFHVIGSRLLNHVSNERGLVLALTSLPFISAMFITNDVALVTFIPFAMAVLVMAHMEERVVLVTALMTIAANTGSMLTPIGNAHNLYLKALSGMSTLGFLRLMAPYTIASALLLVLAIGIAFKHRTITNLSDGDGGPIEKAELASDSAVAKPESIELGSYGAGCVGWRSLVYSLLFVLCLLTVGGLVPIWFMCLVVFGAFLVCDRKAFTQVDWALPLTFIMFFIFIGNMKRVPEFYNLAVALVGQHPLEVSVLSSQFISNVPTTILLSGFCSDWDLLIIGADIGGLGTLIASMASLITYKGVSRAYPQYRKSYLLVYTAVCLVFIAVLLGLSWVIR
ncbi:anion transporter [Bifidobacterium aemilianum]|uniref:Anion transporter n=1 Tax=Bifidobacterium aemilianum TaxID=2493120 RepID=A0A366KA72_9BIFI|nr:SLC13 family permease [Bifidobacterium aemilianum]RBP98237.1 anion transporter [Bifidobacterium aemilianum]